MPTSGGTLLGPDLVAEKWAYLHDVDFLETLDEVVHEGFCVLVVDEGADELEATHVRTVGARNRPRILLRQHAHFQHLRLVDDVLNLSYKVTKQGDGLYGKIGKKSILSRGNGASFTSINPSLPFWAGLLLDLRKNLEESIIQKYGFYSRFFGMSASC